MDQGRTGRDVRVLDESNPAQTIKHPIFKAEIDPDIRFLGFDLTKKVAKGNADPAANDPGWFFVIQERPGEPRFGLDNLSDESPATPSQLERARLGASRRIRDVWTLSISTCSADRRDHRSARRSDSPGAGMRRTWLTSFTRFR